MQGLKFQAQTVIGQRRILPIYALLTVHISTLALLTITALGLLLRFHHLDLRPIDDIEASYGTLALRIQAMFLGAEFNGLSSPPFTYQIETQRGGAGIHGPLLHLINAASFSFAGVTPWVLRASSALAGVLLVMSPLILRRWLSPPQVIAAMLLIAVSPSLILVSRQTLSDPFMALFIMGLVGSVAAYATSRTPVFLYASAALVGLMAATKEDWWVSAVPIITAVIIHELWHRRVALPGPQTLLHYTGAVAVLGVSIIAFYALLPSDGFTSLKTFIDSHAYMLEYASTPQEGNPGMSRMVSILLTIETPILVLGIIGAAYYCLRAMRQPDAARVALSAWAVSALVAYVFLITRPSTQHLVFVLVPAAVISAALLSDLLRLFHHRAPLLAVLLISAFLLTGIPRYGDFTGHLKAPYDASLWSQRQAMYNNGEYLSLMTGTGHPVFLYGNDAHFLDGVGIWGNNHVWGIARQGEYPSVVSWGDLEMVDTPSIVVAQEPLDTARLEALWGVPYASSDMQVNDRVFFTYTPE